MADERPPDERPTEFLPPQAPGPEPEVGAPQAPQPPQAPQAPYPQQQQPAGAWQQPPPQAPPPGYPPYGWQQQAPQPGAWGYAPQPVQPDNGPAVAGFVLSLVAGALLFLSAGLSSLVSVGCAIAGIVYSRKGKKKVESGETTKNAGLAQAGFIIGIISLVLAVMATLVWALVVVAAITDDEFRRDLENEFDEDSISAALRVAAVCVRLAILAAR
ncbi:MAG: hypothetical protein ABW135_09970 [Thermoleophilaceae bacterium]